MLHSNINLIYDLKVIILDCMKLDAFVAYACSFGNNLLVFNAFVKKKTVDSIVLDVKCIVVSLPRKKYFININIKGIILLVLKSQDSILDFL